jgi:hypothetical protein
MENYIRNLFSPTLLGQILTLNNNNLKKKKSFGNISKGMATLDTEPFLCKLVPEVYFTNMGETPFD